MQTKQCRECQEVLPIEKFGKSVQSKDGHMYVCDDCRARLLQFKRRRTSLTLLPSQERDTCYVNILTHHGHSSAAFYLRCKNAGWDPELARRLAEAAYSNNDVYGRLRRRLGITFRF